MSPQLMKRLHTYKVNIIALIKSKPAAQQQISFS